MKKIIAFMTAAVLLFSIFSVYAYAENNEVRTITLSSSLQGESYVHEAYLDGEKVNEYDYTFHNDPSGDYDEVKDAPGVYYTGTEPAGGEAVYIAHDIVCYPSLPLDGFKKVNYDGETEWVYYYESEKYGEYIFSTLPVSGDTPPSSMMHTESEAFENAVLHITEAGTYEIKGEWHGQIKIDLGDDAYSDENAVVKLILSGTDITCTVAPAVLFYSVYECDGEWEERENYTAFADTSEAGANVFLSEGTVNNISGANVFRLLKTKYKSDSDEDKEVRAQKKYVKTDAAFYSYMSMNISGEGTLNITSSFEGVGSELHLTVSGGNLNIYSQDDGINVNEDGVSVLTFSAGTTHIFGGLGNEGDGIDSNGFIVINGGTLITTAKPQSDSGLDSDSGTYIYGGTVIALGSAMDGVSEDKNGENQVSVNLGFSSMQKEGEALILTGTDGNIVFAYAPEKDGVFASCLRSFQGAIISSPCLEKGKTYNLYVGGEIDSDAQNGIFTASDNISLPSDSVRQAYNSAGSSRHEGEPPQMPDGNAPSLPEGEPPQMPDGNAPSLPEGEPPQMPDGNAPSLPEGEPPQMPDGNAPSIPEGEPPQMSGGAPESSAATLSDNFVLNEYVNSFSGVAAYSESNTAEKNIFRKILDKIISFFRGVGEFFRRLYTGELFNKK